MWDKFKRIFIILFIAGLFPGLIKLIMGTYGSGHGLLNQTLHPLLVSVIISEIFTLTVGSVATISYLLVRENIAAKYSFISRILIEFLVTNTASLTTMALVSFFVIPLYAAPEEFTYQLKNNLLITFLMNTILTTISESLLFYRDWQQTLLEKERLEKENLSIRFEALKNQLNPHFLFNSMNTLSSLIHIDTEKADAFINNFSNMLRLLLSIKDQQLILLSEELDFINSWIFLQKTRFEESLQVNMDIRVNPVHYLIPPMTIQLLFENALKHNVATRQQPLTIDLEVLSGQIRVSNNIAPKKHRQASTGIGLKNLEMRYELLGEKLPVISHKGNRFTVTCALIKKQLTHDKSRDHRR